MSDTPKNEDEAIEPVPDQGPDIWQMIDWVFFAGAPIGEPDDEQGDETDVRDDGLGE